ncbi:MAG TPA: GntR family transcriptional regulator [Steroidobacteraceae bacterium]|jgi:DNA-binding GntR family transcriptional regulator
MTLDVRSSVEALAQCLRDDIFAGRLTPGQPIPQEEVSARYGMSRSPLREALRQLEAEGMIEYRANRGAIVASIDEQKVRHIYEVRRMLEAGAMRLVLANIHDQAMAEFKRFDAEVRAAKDAAAFIHTHHEFHRRIYESAGNPLLAKAINDHTVKALLVPKVQELVRAIKGCSESDHARLLEAFRRRDLRASRKATLEHLDHVEAVILGALRSRASKS